MKILVSSVVATAMIMASANAFSRTICNDIKYSTFQDAVNIAYEETLGFGFGLGMWATLMDTSGKVCAVYSVDGESATNNGGQEAGNTAWLGSRVISAQKANTANAFSLDGLAISTGAISVAVYPGGSLYGLQHSNPVDTSKVYKGSANTFGTKSDTMKNKRPGGVNVFGGGVALYDGNGVKVGAVGVSGDTSCRDHAMAYRLRAALGLDNQPNDDGLKFVATPAALFEQPECGVNDPTASAASNAPTAADDYGSR